MDTTTQDLVTRLRYEADTLARYGRGASAAIDVMREAADIIAAATAFAAGAPPALIAFRMMDAILGSPAPAPVAPPADLVALVLRMQRAFAAVKAITGGDRIVERDDVAADIHEEEAESLQAVLAWRPSAPPEPAPLPCGCAPGHCEASTPADCAVIQASAREAL